MTPFFKEITRRVIWMLAALVFAAPMAGCVMDAGPALAFINRYSTMSDTEKTAAFESTFGADSNPALKTKLMNLAYGDNLVYVSPEQQAGFFSNYSSFMYSVAPALLNGMDVSKLATPGDSFYDFLQALQDYWPVLLSTLKDQNAGVVAERLAAVKKRTGTFFEYLTPAQVRDIVWDNSKFNAFMNDPAVARDELIAGVPNSDPDLIRSVLSEFYAPLLIPTGQPPS
jgi:hypothetical protein